jgi:hypothetical protein
MKTAYELAMERLNASDPDGARTLNDGQKKEIAEIAARYKAKIAEREIFLNKQLQEAFSQQKADEVEKIRRQLADEKIRLQEEMEAAKEKVRQRK